MGLGRLLVRATVGGYFVGHGMQKLAGWFGGDGPDATGRFFEAVGLRPGRRQALLAGGTEAGAGALVVLGLATPAATAALIGVMVGAIRHVHWAKGPWNTKGGYELNLGLIATLAALAETGPGPLSLDSALGIERTGDAVAAGALLAGAAGSIALSTLARRQPPASAQPDAAADPDQALATSSS